MRDALNQLDTSFFLWLNGLHAPWLDSVMILFTERNTWIPFYVILVGWLIWRYRRSGAAMVFTLAASVAISDQLCSSVLKPLTHRLRPCHEGVLQPLIHPVLPCGGLYGFASSHAANTFALAMGLWLLVGRTASPAEAGYPMFRWLFLWATLVAYSRIYVGAHYPLDVLAGAGLGTLSAWVCVQISYKLFSKSFALDKR